MIYVIKMALDEDETSYYVSLGMTGLLSIDC